MLFNSVSFFVFFTVLYTLYLRFDHKKQNLLLLIGSYIFYGAWDWRFLSLIFFSTFVDYLCGLRIHNESDERKRKFFLGLSLFTNLSLLGFFKYFNFFIDSFVSLFALFGVEIQSTYLNIILPVGISFYTFQTMSYTIDIYRRKMEPAKDFSDFALFVAFFPQLVAGPIERASHLLPQILKPRKVTLELFYQGAFLVYWGIFLKVFIADNLATIVDPVFAGKPGSENGVIVLIAIYAFAFQIYCDFAGYSYVARGLCKCMGFDIMVNFNVPYFAKNPQDFWKRWHISLSSWLRDYLYISLGGNKNGQWKTYRNLTLTMLIGGLWHGAAWTFIVWGAYQGGLLVVHRFFQPYFSKLDIISSVLTRRGWEAVKILIFFQFVCLGWLIFRADSMSTVSNMLTAIFSNFTFVEDVSFNLQYLVFFSGILIIVQWFQYHKDDLLIVYKAPQWVKVIFYSITLLLIIVFGVTNGSEFIYFQF